MKKILLIALTASTLLAAGTSNTWAHYRDYDRRQGYWDRHHQYHRYTYYHHHRGYWDERNGVRIFIRL